MPRDDGAGRRRLTMILKRCRTLAAAKVAEYLAYLARRKGSATPSRAAIAAHIGRCERTVSRALGELESIGAVRVWRDPPHRRTDGTFTRRRTNLYVLCWPPKALVAPTGHACPVYALSEAIEPTGDAAGRSPSLFDPAPDTSEPEPPAPDKPTAPPWVREGISRDEWIRRQRNDA